MDIAVEPGGLWSAQALGRIPVGTPDGDGVVSAVEVHAERGYMTPLHAHDEEEGVYVVDGCITVYAGDAVHRLEVGESVVTPKDVAHTFRVETDDATVLLLGASGRFADFLRAATRPAMAAVLAPVPDGPATDAVASLVALAAVHGIRVVGPPGMLPSGRAERHE
jgi:quercetin dioxygenase-like cupin family protein